VLLYHRIDADGGHLSISPAAFDEQMKWLAEKGYTAITPSDLSAALAGSAPLPLRSVMITDDDGYRSTLAFTSTVRKYGFRGVYFWPNWAELTPAAMLDIAKDGEIRGHNVDHADLTTQTLAEQEHEIVDNQRWLRRRTGQAVDCFAYPMGRSNANSIVALDNGHFAFAFDAAGVESTLATLDRFHIARAAINHEVSLDDFIVLMTPGY
jgi:peptidoglycan/xylan/chitin deacetylase (PgdA/CDA1 family)